MSVKKFAYVRKKQYLCSVIKKQTSLTHKILKIMITILSFIARNGEKLMFSEVSYDLMTKEVFYSHFDSNGKKLEKRKYKSIIIPTAYYQADLRFALKNGYKINIEETE